MTEQEKQIEDYIQEEVVLYGRNNDILERILIAIESVNGKMFVESVLECIKVSEINGFYPSELVNEPIGEWQADDDISDGIWVQQWSVGDTGDSWEGYVCIQLKENMYFKFRFSM